MICVKVHNFRKNASHRKPEQDRSHGSRGRPAQVANHSSNFPPAPPFFFRAGGEGGSFAPLLNDINFSPKVFDARSGKAMRVSVTYSLFISLVRSKWRAIGELSTTPT